jgi:hypothetical protein
VAVLFLLIGGASVAFVIGAGPSNVWRAIKREWDDPTEGATP